MMAPQKHINHTSNQKCEECSQRQHDEHLSYSMQQEIVENFQERIQLRKSLMEVEEQNAINALEI